MAQESSYWALELERQAESIGDKTFLYLVYEDRSITYKEMDQNANRFANYLLGIGAQPGDGLATLMGNSPQFLDVFFGIQKIGMYINTVNTGLRGEGLAFIIDNSDAKFLVVDYDKIDLYRSVENETPQLRHIIVNTLEAPKDYVVPKGMLDLRDAYKSSVSTVKPKVSFSPDSPAPDHVYLRHHGSPQGGRVQIQQKPRGQDQAPFPARHETGFGLLHAACALPRQCAVRHDDTGAGIRRHACLEQEVQRQPVLG